MRNILWALALAFAVAQGAAGLDGRQIRVVIGESPALHVPISVPCAETVEGKIFVTHGETGKQFPATLRDGALTFVPEGGSPRSTHVFTVGVESLSDGHAPVVLVSKRDDADIVDVLIEDKLFTSYHYGADYKKPFLWPVNSAGGIGVTRDFPMEVGDTPRFARDHPHHKSFYTAYGEVNGVDLWAEGTRSGRQVADEVTFGSGDAYGWIRSKNTWRDVDGNALVTETREYRFYATPEKGRLFDARVTLSADHGEVRLTDTKEGGIVSARMRPELSYAKANITNAHGDTGEAQTWGKPSPWCDFSGELEVGGWRGLAIFDHPANFRHPTSWHVRNYGLMGANAFGYSYFNEKDYNKGLIPENGDHTIAPGEALSFQYRIFVHSGNVETAKVADRYADYATPPHASWLE